MIDNLTEAISHAKEKAEELKDRAYTDFDSWTDEGKAKANGCLECAAEHEQLASWLEELDERREADRWIPVTERLPNTLGVYNVIKKMTEGETVYVISTACYFDGQNTWHDDNRVNHSRLYPDVIAWKPKPEPYESEAENE